MQLTCQRNSLTAAFQTVAGVVPTRTPKDILKNVKLLVSGGKATLIGTDSEIGMRCDVPDVQSDSRGEALLPTARVLAVLRELSDDVVKLEVTGDATWIRCGYSEFRLSAEDPADFPPVATFEDADYFVVPAAALRTADSSHNLRHRQRKHSICAGRHPDGTGRRKTDSRRHRQSSPWPLLRLRRAMRWSANCADPDRGTG